MGAHKPNTSAAKMCEGVVERDLFRLTSRGGMITSVAARFASKKRPTSLKLRHTRSAKALFSGIFSVSRRAAP